MEDLLIKYKSIKFLLSEENKVNNFIYLFITLYILCTTYLSMHKQRHALGIFPNLLKHLNQLVSSIWLIYLQPEE